MTGRGPDRAAWEAERPTPEGARDARRQRAREEALGVRERDDLPYRSFEVRNPTHGTRYRVLAPGPEPLLLCPCPDFGRRDVGTCKHVEAVVDHLAGPRSEALRRRSAPSTEAWWAETERELAALGSVPITRLTPLWAIGRRLVGGPEDPESSR